MVEQKSEIINLSVLKSPSIMKAEASFLPRFSVFYPIQNTSGEGMPWHTYIGSGVEEENQFLVAPYFLSCLGVRQVVRTKNEDGITYIRSYPDAKSEAAKSRLEVIAKSEKKESGYVALLVVVIPESDGNSTLTSVCTCELYKTHVGYWADCFAAAQFTEKKKSLTFLF